MFHCNFVVSGVDCAVFTVGQFFRRSCLTAISCRYRLRWDFHDRLHNRGKRLTFEHFPPPRRFRMEPNFPPCVRHVSHRRHGKLTECRSSKHYYLYVRNVIIINVFFLLLLIIKSTGQPSHGLGLRRHNQSYGRVIKIRWAMNCQPWPCRRLACWTGDYCLARYVTTRVRDLEIYTVRLQTEHELERHSIYRAHTSADVAKSLVLNRRRVTYRSMRNMEVPT